jgi:hypothetical protein
VIFLQKPDDVWAAGTTTLAGGICVEMADADENSEKKWVFVVGILGDLKVYHYVAEMSEFVLCDVCV